MSASDKQEKIEKVIVTRTSNRVWEEEAYREMFKNSCSQAVLASVPKRPITRSVTRGGYIYIVTVLYIYICPGLVKPFSMEHVLCEHVYMGIQGKNGPRHMQLYFYDVDPTGTRTKNIVFRDILQTWK